MPKYVDCEIVKDKLSRTLCLHEELPALIDSIPAADVRPVVKSKWDDKRVSFYRGCPKCGAFVSADLDEVFLRDFPSAVGKLNFCPNCGADMREES